MDYHESRLCPSTHQQGSASHRQHNRRRLWLMMLGLVATFSQPMWVVAAPPEHAKAVFMDGEITMIHIDEVIPEHSRFAYFLHPKGGSVEDVIEMIFEGEPPGKLHTGKKVKIKGRGANGKVWVSDVVALDGESSSASTNASVSAATTGDRKTITFVINMTGVDYAAHGASPYTQTHVSSSGIAMHDPVQFSVNSAYEEASFGQVTFSGSSATDVFLVSIPYDPAESCAYRTIASQADAASPVNLTGYRHRMYVVPPKAISGCGWLALGEVGSYGSTSPRRSWSTRIDPIAFAHELGHNIGWHHAATDPDNDGVKNVEYGDTSDLMGYCCSKRKLNSVHIDQVGWFDRADLQDKIIDVTGAGQYFIAPLGTSPGLSSDPQILRIIPSTGRPYYLSYRQRTGLDAGMSSIYTTGVNIHRGTETDNWSYLVKVLKSDFSSPSLYEFHDAANNLTITQVENNANFVTVDISYGGTCVTGAPQVTVTPTSQMLTDSSQLQPYNVTMTNTDTSECESSTWNVGLTSPLSGTVTTPVLAVAPGASASTSIQMDVAGVADGQYPITIDVMDGADISHNVQVAASLTLNMNACVMSAPTVMLVPNQQMIADVSQLQAFTLNVTNHDSSACNASAWSVGVTSSLSSEVVPSFLNVMPGATEAASIMMDVVGVSDGTFPLTVTVSDGKSGHNGSATGTLQMDLTPPSAPSNVTAQLTGKGRKKSVQLSWNSANDGSSGTGVASYNLYRNGIMLGSTTNLNFKDSNFSTTTPNLYELYAVDHVGHVSATSGSVTYTYSGGSSKPGGGKGRNK